MNYEGTIKKKKAYIFNKTTITLILSIIQKYFGFFLVFSGSVGD